MKYFILILIVFMQSGCAMFLPTGYIEKKECGIVEELSSKAECYGGFSDTMISAGKYMVTFEGNEFTTLQRATDLAILHCTEVALASNNQYIFIEIAERRLITSISSSKDQMSTTDNPIVSVYCNISNENLSEYIKASNLRKQLQKKYGFE